MFFRPLLFSEKLRQSARRNCGEKTLAALPAHTRTHSAGFTITELLVVLVIIGVLSALALPSLGRDRKARLGVDYANLLVRELQRARVDAVTERLPQRVYVFRDRIEVRPAVPAARPGQPPRAPTLADPVTRVLVASVGVNAWEVLPVVATPASIALSPSTYREIEFNARGQAQLVGFPALTPAFLYLENAEVPANHPDARHRLDVAPLTARVSLRTGWN